MILFSQSSLPKLACLENNLLFNKCQSLTFKTWREYLSTSPLKVCQSKNICRMRFIESSFYLSVPLKRDGLTFSLCCAHAAHCISINTIAISLICIWMGALFWSVAPLLGWGSFTGLSPHTHLPPHPDEQFDPLRHRRLGLGMTRESGKCSTRGLSRDTR